MPTEERLAYLIEMNTKSFERAMARIEKKSMKAIRAYMKAIQATKRQ